MSNTEAENVGAILTGAPSSFNQQNFFGAGQPQPLPNNIGSPMGFVGREKELKELQKEYSDGKRVFILHGLGGAGKSELARKFIEENKNDFEAFVEIEMNGLSVDAFSPKDAMLIVIRAFTSHVEPNLDETQIKSRYISLLNQHKTVLLFDNSKDRSQIEPLSVSKNVLLVITSRDNFTLSAGTPKLIGEMSSEDAKALLFSIAGEARLDGHANELANLAGYMPMALLPLASILAEDITEDAQRLVEKYSERKERLKLQDPHGQNLTVEVSFDLSYDRLGEELKKRWLVLTVFSSDFGEEALETIWNGRAALFASSSKAKRVKESLSALVKANLIIFDNGRFRLHDIARDYTREKVGEEERVIAERLHATYYGEYLQKLNKPTLQSLRRFDIEYINIEQGFDWSAERIELDTLVASTCLKYVSFHAYKILALRLSFGMLVDWSEIGVKAARKINSKQKEGAALDSLASAYIRCGAFEKAIETGEKAVAIAREIGHRQGEAASLCNLGTAHSNLGKREEAIEFYEQALPLTREIGDKDGESSILCNLGNAYGSLGENQKAIGYYEQSLKLAKEVGSRQTEGANLGNWGVAYEHLGENQKAVEFYQQAFVIAKEIGDKEAEARLLRNLGDVYQIQGDNEQARKLFEQALEILESIESFRVEETRKRLLELKKKD